MKKQGSNRAKWARFVAGLATLGLVGTAWAGGPGKGSAGVFPPQSSPRGQSYAEWSADSVEFALELPLEGHPGQNYDPIFDASYGQVGNVWFLGAPFGTVERWSSIPTSTMLFLVLLNTECSSLEPPDSGFHGDTEAERRQCATFWSDHIVNVFCVVDGVEVENINQYRFVSPQFEFDAPTPWIFGETGGHGSSVADGYYVMLHPLSKGEHTIHFGGSFHFAAGELGPDPVDLPIDMTYHLTVRPHGK